MNKLVQNELKKVSKKKGLYVIGVIVLILMIMINILSKKDANAAFDDYEMSKENINYLTESLQELNPNTTDDIEMYVSLKSQLEYIDFASKYESGSWQRNIANEKAHGIIYNIQEAKYNFKNAELIAKYESELEDLRTKLDNNDWKDFITKERDEVKSSLENNKKQLESETNKNRIEELKLEIDREEVTLYCLNYRLENSVPYANTELNYSLQSYEDSMYELLTYNTENLSENEKAAYEKTKSEVEIYKYKLDNKIDDIGSLYGKEMLKSVVDDYLIFFIIFTVMVAGTIVSEEYNKGTIKMLLIRPYSRTQILMSKFITSIITLVMSIAFIVFAQFIIGGIAFGFGSYSSKIIMYDFVSSSIVTLSIFKYIGMQLLAVSPMILLIFALSFTISTIFASNAFSITFPLLTYIFSEFVNLLIIGNGNKILIKYFPTMCWDLREYLFGMTPNYQYASLNTSIIMNIVYFVILLTASIIVFKKKNIKNI